MKRIVLIACAAATALAAAAPAAHATFPGGDGRIAFAPGRIDSGTHLDTVRPDGSDRRVVVRGALSAKWSADGRLLAYGTPEGVYVARADGSKARQVSPHPGFFALSPDGRTIVISKTTRPDPELDVAPALFAVDVATGRERYLTRRGSSPVFAADGRTIYFVDHLASGSTVRRIGRVDLDGAGRRVIYAGPTVETLDVSPDGRTIAFLERPRTGPGFTLALLDVRSRAVTRRLATGSFAFTGLAWSPRGTRIAAGRWDGNKRYELVTVSPITGRVTVVRKNGQSPAWQPIRR